MRRRSALLTSSAMVIACIVLIAIQSGSPLLYSPRSDAIADDHVNPAALSRVTGDRASQVLPLVSDLLNSPGSLVLNIKAGDFENVARELEEYRQVSQNLDNLVINLDMTESELAEFQKANKENLYILTELFNGTERWEELKTLEIRYREGGDAQMLTSITYEGEALQRRIQDLYRDYLEQEEVMVGTGEKFDMDTSGYLQSERDFRDIVSQVEAGQEERQEATRATDIPGERPYQLTIDLENGEASYSETVGMRGQLLVAGRDSPDEVDLFIDSHKESTLTTVNNGSFSYHHLVEHDRAGTHTVFAVYSGSVFSEIRTFLVETKGTSLDLQPPMQKEAQVVFNGQLRADTIPVVNAPIEILSDGKSVSSAFTDANGYFSIAVKIPPGTHRVRARFLADSFPLSPSESPEYTLFIPEPSIKIEGDTGLLANPLQLGILAASICASCIAAFLYLRHRTPGSIPAPPVFYLPGGGQGEGRPGGENGKVEEHPAGIPPTKADLTPVGPMGADERVSGRELYHFFSTLRLAASRHLAFLHPNSLTPRELCAMCRGLAISTAVCRFTRGYEQAIYGGEEVSETDRDLLIQSYSSAMEDLEGIDH